MRPEPNEGARFSRKARNPSWPSGDTRLAAIVLAVIGAASSIDSPATSRMSALVAATASGPAASTSFRHEATAWSSPAAGTTWWTRPISWARRAEKRAPVKLVYAAMLGATGRLIVSGTDDAVAEARNAVLSAIA